MSIEWMIIAIDRDTATDRATTAHWRVIGEDGSASASAYGAVSIERYAAETPYARINEAMAIAWTKAALGKGAVEAAEAGVEEQLAGQKNPATETGQPWSAA